MLFLARTVVGAEFSRQIQSIRETLYNLQKIRANLRSLFLN